MIYEGEGSETPRTRTRPRALRSQRTALLIVARTCGFNELKVAGMIVAKKLEFNARKWGGSVVGISVFADIAFRGLTGHGLIESISIGVNILF